VNFSDAWHQASNRKLPTRSRPLPLTSESLLPVSILSCHSRHPTLGMFDPQIRSPLTFHLSIQTTPILCAPSIFSSPCQSRYPTISLSHYSSPLLLPYHLVTTLWRVLPHFRRPSTLSKSHTRSEGSWREQLTIRWPPGRHKVLSTIIPVCPVSAMFW
jgi:hypothetical protein